MVNYQMKKNRSNFQIDNFIIGGKSTFLIAEIGNNHNGSYDLAIELIDKAVESGANCVKFQIRSLKNLYTPTSLKKEGEDLGVEYIIDLLKKYQLNNKEHKKIFKYCLQKNISYMSSPWDIESFNFLNNLGVSAFKLASADLTNIPLIDSIIKTKKPLILSTGMSTIEEIKITANHLNSLNVNFALLHCNSTYPAPTNDINLKFMNKLKKYCNIIGYSGHERGINISIASLCFGAKIIERHFTIDKKMEGPDHSASLLPNEFKKMVDGIREIESALGVEDKKISQGEMMNRENLSKSIVASTKLKRGTIIKKKHLTIMSPGKGISPQNIPKLIGKKINRDIEKFDFFYFSDVLRKKNKIKKYSFSRPWGIPVRYYDFQFFNQMINPDLWELHLSYSDMEIDFSKYLPRSNKSKFVVHAPELFKNSLLMDLASKDQEVRKKSILETQKVIDITIELKEYFNSEKPFIVANIGGLSTHKALNRKKIHEYYLRFGDSLSKLKFKNQVEVLVQTMAPFPWHFGGQRYQNLFVLPDDIIHWAEKLNINICLDVSHSFLMANFYKINFYNFVKDVSKFVKHIHMGDAKGFNGEGLQIGEGEINFTKLNKILKQFAPEASFIPEIWQGHKNEGEGFWIALDRLNQKL